MLLREVEYARPASVQEALRLLGANDGARALAGGQTLINVMKARAASPDVLVDLADIGELRGIELGSDGTLELGAMTTYTDVIDSAEARARPILGEVCNQIADVQVRNRGTLGGNVCSNDPTNHLPPLFVAIGATMTIVGPGGERSVPAQEFFLGVYMTAVGPGELLTKSPFPPGKGRRLRVGPDRKGRDVHRQRRRFAWTAARHASRSVASTPSRSCSNPTRRRMMPYARQFRARTWTRPWDVHASADYRRHLAEVLALRAVAQAAGRK